MGDVRPSQVDQAGGIRLRGWRWWRVALSVTALLGLAAAWIFWPVRAPQIRIARETTYLLGPVMADGTINYLAALNQMQSAGVTAESNAAIDLLRAFGPRWIRSNSNPSLGQAILKQLGMADLPAEGEYFVPLGDFVRQRHPELLPDSKGTGKVSSPPSTAMQPWRNLLQREYTIRPADRPLTDEWLQVNARALEWVARASNKPHLFVPLCSAADPPTLVDTPCIDVLRMQDAWGGLMLRSRLLARDGRLEEAWQDVGTLHRMAGLLCGQVLAMGFEVGCQADCLAWQAASDIATQQGLSAAQARSMLAILRAWPELPTAERAISLGERCFALDHAMMLARAPMRGSGGVVPAHRAGGIDFNAALREMNERFDLFLATIHAASYFERVRLRAEETARAERRRAEISAFSETGWVLKSVGYAVRSPRARMRYRSEVFGGGLALFSVPSLGGVDNERLRAVAMRDLAACGLGLAIWREEKGAYPERLDELTPRILPVAPVDPFSDAPLLYRRTEAGYVLYSVGPNGKDDGAVDPSTSPKTVDDIVVRVPAKGTGLAVSEGASVH